MSSLVAGDGLDPRALGGRSNRVIGPWPQDHLVWVLLSNSVGLVLVAAAWWVVSGSGVAHDHMGWVAVAVVGLIMAIGTDVWWLARGQRVLASARAAVFAPAVLAGIAAASSSGIRRSGSSMSFGGAEEMVSGSGMGWFHRVGCELTLGKAVQARSRKAWVSAGAHPCEVCLP